MEQPVIRRNRAIGLEPAVLDRRQWLIVHHQFIFIQVGDKSILTHGFGNRIFCRGRKIWHLGLVGKPSFFYLKRGVHAEDRLAVLDHGYSSGGKRAAVPDSINRDNNGYLSISGPKKVTVQGMRGPIRVHGSTGCNKRLSHYLAPIKATGSTFRVITTEEVGLNLFYIKYFYQFCEASMHALVSLLNR